MTPLEISPRFAPQSAGSSVASTRHKAALQLGGQVHGGESGWPAAVQWEAYPRRVSVLRKPQATRLTCLTSRLKPSVLALVRLGGAGTPGSPGHQVSIAVARRCSSRMWVSAHQVKR